MADLGLVGSPHEVAWAQRILREHAPGLAVDEIIDDGFRNELEIEMNRLRGRLLGLLESFGLEERHERACKSTLKSLSYDMQAILDGILEEAFG